MSRQVTTSFNVTHQLVSTGAEEQKETLDIPEDTRDVQTQVFRLQTMATKNEEQLRARQDRIERLSSEKLSQVSLDTALR